MMNLVSITQPYRLDAMKWIWIKCEDKLKQGYVEIVYYQVEKQSVGLKPYLMAYQVAGNKLGKSAAIYA